MLSEGGGGLVCLETQLWWSFFEAFGTLKGVLAASLYRTGILTDTLELMTTCPVPFRLLWLRCPTGPQLTHKKKYQIGCIKRQ